MTWTEYTVLNTALTVYQEWERNLPAPETREEAEYQLRMIETAEALRCRIADAYVSAHPKPYV